MRNTPANAVYLGNFEMMKQAYCGIYDCAPNAIPGHIVLGAAGEVPGHIASTPYIVGVRSETLNSIFRP